MVSDKIRCVTLSKQFGAQVFPLSSRVFSACAVAQSRCSGVFTYLSKIVTWQCGLSSVRVGGASHPGPGSSPSNELLVLPQVNKRPRSASPARPAHPPPLSLGRWYCPVSSCPDLCQESSRGWTSFKGLQFHLDLHFMGDLSGQVPLDWLHQQGYGVCSVCNRVLSSHFNGLPLHLLVDPSSTGHLVCLMSPPPTVDSALPIPAGARDLWSKCLTHPLASVVAHRDERSWVDLLTMPALTLGGPSRGGRHHAPRQAITVSRRGQDWLDGLRAELWEPSGQPASHRQQDLGSDFRLPSHVSNRAASLIEDGALRRAGTALTQEPPVQPTPSVIDELWGLHPLPRPQDSALLSCLRAIGPAAAPCVSPDMIRKAVSDFSPTSGAGASGHRPGHLQQAMRLATCDQLLSLLAEVVPRFLPLQGPRLCGSSLLHGVEEAFRCPQAHRGR